MAPNDSTYLSISLATLRANIKLGFDVFIHISEKHILYIRGADSIENERLERLASKNVRHLYILDKDREAYEVFLKASQRAALSDPHMPLAEKAEVINGQAKSAVEKMFENPESKENFEKAEQSARAQVELLKKVPAALETMMKIAEHDKTTYQHSVNVSNLAISLAAKLGAAPEVCEIVGTGALLHDIGRGALTQGDMTADKYSQHPRAGAQMLKGKPYITKDVLDIILLHEERLDGKGYPGGLKKIEQLFQIVGLCNLYDRHVTLMGEPPDQAFAKISAMNPPPYQKELILALKDVLAKHKIL
ncbi:MAG TPA: HD domain-containing phosphohydrolase [Oligoflexia bacterium]|nr:HD domain-containing phosphohydrolase [Oligoflexia bacterium]